MDPQNRILLEQAQLALADAGASLGSLTDTKTGVYVGCMYQEFTQLQYNLGYKISPGIATGNGISYLGGRLSYTFGLTGPCVSTDTACSSSLVAAHLAHKVHCSLCRSTRIVLSHIKKCQGMPCCLCLASGAACTR